MLLALKPEPIAYRAAAIVAPSTPILPINHQIPTGDTGFIIPQGFEIFSSLYESTSTCDKFNAPESRFCRRWAADPCMMTNDGAKLGYETFTLGARTREHV
jgi:hypothetical protein